MYKKALLWTIYTLFNFRRNYAFNYFQGRIMKQIMLYFKYYFLRRAHSIEANIDHEQINKKPQQNHNGVSMQGVQLGSSILCQQYSKSTELQIRFVWLVLVFRHTSPISTESPHYFDASILYFHSYDTSYKHYYPAAHGGLFWINDLCNNVSMS